MTTRYIHSLNRNRPIMLPISCSETFGRGSRGSRGALRSRRAWHAVRAGRGRATDDPERTPVPFGQGAIGLDMQATML